MIHIENISEVYDKKNVPLWLLSAFKAGFINSAGFLATGKYVSHVTGFGTQVGIAIGHDDYFFGAELLIIPISFIMGGVMTSWLLDRNYQRDEIPPYWKVQGLITALIALIIFLGEWGAVQRTIPFDTDGSYNALEFSMMALLCLICGLKNGLVTWSTFGKIRVTHLTGLSTDIGLNLIRTFQSRHPSPRFKEDRKVNFLRLMTFAFFSVGAFISAILFPVIGLKGFLLVFLISLFMTVHSIMDGRNMRARILKKNGSLEFC